MLFTVPRSASRNPSAQPPNFVNIVNAIGLFLFDVLVKMSAQRRRRELLMAVLTFFVLDRGTFGGLVPIMRVVV
jgi:hypothetical protein